MFKSAVKKLYSFVGLVAMVRLPRFPPVPRLLVIPPAVGVGQLEVHSGRKVVCRLSRDPVHILLSVENIVIDQVRIERVLLGSVDTKR